MKNSPAGKSKSLKINLDIYVYKYYDFFHNKYDDHDTYRRYIISLIFSCNPEKNVQFITPVNGVMTHRNSNTSEIKNVDNTFAAYR